MSNLVVITFADVEQAGSVREALKQAQSGGYISLDDSAVIVREANPDVAISILSSYKGKIYHTSLPPEAEESLRRALKDKTG